MPNRPPSTNKDYVGEALEDEIPASDIPRTNNLSAAIRQLNAAILSIPKNVARAAGEVAGKVHEEVRYGKKEHAGRVGAALGGPIGAVVAQSILDSETVKSIQNSIKDKVKELGSKTFQSIKRTVTPKRDELDNGGKIVPLNKNIPRGLVTASTLYKKSPDLVTAIDRLRISNIAAIRQAKVYSETDLRKKEIPKAAKGGTVTATGKAIVHRGEIIQPKTAVEKQVSILIDIQRLQQEQLGSLEALKLALSDEEGAGGFFKSVGNTLSMLIPLFGGGMYKSDIARSTNPFVTITSGILEMYRWQRLYGELNKRQLNELIKLQGGETQDVYGKRGVIAEFLMRRRTDLLKTLDAYIAKKDKAGEKSRVAKAFRWGLGGLIGDVISQDFEQLTVRLREMTFRQLDSKIKELSDIAEGKGPKKKKLKKEEEGITWKKLKSFLGEWTLGGVVKESRAKTSTGIESKLFPMMAKAEKQKSKLEEKGKYGSSVILEKINKNVIEIKKQLQKKTKATPVHAFKSKPGEVANIVLKGGRRVIPSKKDIVTATEKVRGKASSMIDELFKWFSKSDEQQKIIAESSKSTAATVSQTYDYTKKKDKEVLKKEQARESKEKRQAVWEKFNKGGKSALGKIMDFLSRISGALIGLVPLILLIGMNPTKAWEAIKWTFSAPANFVKMMWSYFSKFAKLFELGNIVKMFKTLNKLPGIMGGIFKFIGETFSAFKSIGLKGALVGTKGIISKTAGKLLLKRIPIVGTVMGVLFGLNRFRKGDILGGIGEVVSGIVQLLDLVAPGVGTLLSLTIDGLLIARDIKLKKQGKEFKPIMSFGEALSTAATTTLKALPVIGPIFGILMGIKKWNKGDRKGAFIDVASGLATMIPAVGPILSVLISSIPFFQKIRASDLKKKPKETPGNFVMAIFYWIKEALLALPKALISMLTAVFIKFPFWVLKMLTKAFVGWFKMWYNIGDWIREKLWSGISALYGIFKGLAGKIFDAAHWFFTKGIFIIFNPKNWLKAVLAVGGGIKSLFVGLKNIIVDVATFTFGKVASSIISGIRGVVEELVPIKKVKEAWKATKEKAVAAKEWAGGKVKGAKEWIGGKAKGAMTWLDKKGILSQQTANKIHGFINKYGYDKVRPLLDKIPSISQLETILRKVSVDPESEYAKKYSSLIDKYPKKKKEIIAYMDAGIDPDDAARHLGIEPVEEKAKEAVADIETTKKEIQRIDKEIVESKESLVNIQNVKRQSYSTIDYATKLQEKISELEKEKESKESTLSPEQKKTIIATVQEISKESTTKEKKVGDWNSKIGEVQSIITKDGRYRTPSNKDIVEVSKSPYSDIEKAKETAVQEHINNSAFALKSSNKLNKSVDESSKKFGEMSAVVVNNFSKIIKNTSNVSNSSGGGGNGKLPLWRDLDSILAGNNI